MRFYFVWEKGVSQFARNFLLRNGLSGFSQKITTKNFTAFLYSFGEVSVLLCKNLLQV